MAQRQGIESQHLFLNVALPPELELFILSKLRVRDILNVSLVSRAWYRLCKDDDMWKVLCLRDFGSNVTTIPPEDQGWKYLYQKIERRGRWVSRPKPRKSLHLNLGYRGKPSPHHVIMLGLDGAGKKTVLNEIRTPRTGLPLVRERYRHLEIRSCCLDCSDKAKPSWRHFLISAEAVIVVVDSANRESLGVLKKEIDEMMEMMASEDKDKKDYVAFLFLANKQDRSDAMSPAEIATLLDLHQTFAGLCWKIGGCSGLTQSEAIRKDLDILETWVLHPH